MTECSIKQAPPPLTISERTKKLPSCEYFPVDVCFDIVSVGILENRMCIITLFLLFFRPLLCCMYDTTAELGLFLIGVLKMAISDHTLLFSCMNNKTEH